MGPLCLPGLSPRQPGWALDMTTSAADAAPQRATGEKPPPAAQPASPTHLTWKPASTTWPPAVALTGCSSPRSRRSCPPAVPGGLVLPTLNSLQLPCKQGILHPHFPKRETEAPRQQLTPLLLYLANAGVQPVRPGRRFFSASLFRKLRCLRTLHPLV